MKQHTHWNHNSALCNHRTHYAHRNVLLVQNVYSGTGRNRLTHHATKRCNRSQSRELAKLAAVMNDVTYLIKKGAPQFHVTSKTQMLAEQRIIASSILNSNFMEKCKLNLKLSMKFITLPSRTCQGISLPLSSSPVATPRHHFQSIWNLCNCCEKSGNVKVPPWLCPVTNEEKDVAELHPSKPLMSFRHPADDKCWTFGHWSYIVWIIRSWSITYAGIPLVHHGWIFLQDVDTCTQCRDVHSTYYSSPMHAILHLAQAIYRVFKPITDRPSCKQSCWV